MKRLTFALSVAALIPLAASALAQDGAGEDEFTRFLASLDWQTSGVAALGDRAQIEVPLGHRFLPGQQASRLLAAMGNLTDGDELGLIGPDDLRWFVIYFFDDVGFVKDDDKDDLDPEALLASMREGMIEGNEIRAQQGLPVFELDGWAIPPRYNEDTRTLEWATRFIVEGEPTVNFKTRVLGRKGVMRVILVTDPSLLDASLPEFQMVMNRFEFVDGQRYDQYVSGDKIAQYGLVALVAGGAGALAAKAGLFGVLAAFLKKGWKLIAVGFVALAAGARRLFGGSREA